MVPNIIKPPTQFDGNLEEFFDKYAQFVLLDKSRIEIFHKNFCDYYEKSEDPIFLVRKVKGLERGVVIRNKYGAQIRATDNSPSWFIHYNLFSGNICEFHHFDSFVESIPCHIHRVHLPKNINRAGWHVAHLYDAKDGNTNFNQWDRNELIRRTARNIHPCNYFYVAKTDWQNYGGNESVIAFFKDKFQTIYQSVWDEFLGLVIGELIPKNIVPKFFHYQYSLTKQTNPMISPIILESKIHKCKAYYKNSKLYFKKDIIDPLNIIDEFCIQTPTGYFIMSKGEFNKTFPNVVKSKSYQVDGVYHYPITPKKALIYFFPN